MIDSTGTLLLALGSSPWAVALAIIAATFVLEDVAIVAAALLAADGTIPPSLALAALVAGIFAGDLALYGLGAAARSQPWAHHFIGERRMKKGRAWLKRRYISALIGARFMPGFRLPTYAASGFLQLPFLPFATVAAFAGFVWTTIVFMLRALQARPAQPVHPGRAAAQCRAAQHGRPRLHAALHPGA